MPTIPELFESMPWGPAPEAPGKATAWLESHGRRFGHVIGGRFTDPAETFDTGIRKTMQEFIQGAGFEAFTAASAIPA